MLYSSSLLAKRLILPALAIVLGASLYVDRSRVMVQDGACRVFIGELSGNDPSASTTMLLCRDGQHFSATLEVTGESGYSKAHLEGRARCDGFLILDDMGPLVSEPNDGWTFCFDDVYALRWDALSQTLDGNFASTECNDRGTVRFH